MSIDQRTPSPSANPDPAFIQSDTPAEGVMGMLSQFGSGASATGAITSDLFDKQKQEIINAITKHRTMQPLTTTIYGDFSKPSNGNQSSGSNSRSNEPAI